MAVAFESGSSVDKGRRHAAAMSHYRRSSTPGVSGKRVPLEIAPAPIYHFLRGLPAALNGPMEHAEAIEVQHFYNRMCIPQHFRINARQTVWT